jgi:hypothetical protein
VVEAAVSANDILKQIAQGDPYGNNFTGGSSYTLVHGTLAEIQNALLPIDGAIHNVQDFIKKIVDIVAQAKKALGFRDPHLVTFDGLYYNFQTAGEFILTQQTSGGNFAVQARISAPIGASSYSVITELGIQVGNDRVTIDSTRANVVWVNGVAATFINGVDTLAGGTITQNGSSYLVTLNTGESVNAQIVSNGTQYGPGTTSQGINTTVSLNPFVETPGSVQGLLGNANGNPANDLTLADGTVLPTNMPSSELYGAYADSWRVAQATSLLDYGPGQTTQTFTDKNYPGTPITLASFPQAQVQAAMAVAEQLGITDPGLLQDAAYDYLVTGDPSILLTEANLQQQGLTTALQADPTLPAAPPEVGIIAAQTSETEAASGPTTAQFEIYRSGDTSAAATVTYTVTAPGSTYVGAASFGGTLPSGTVTFAAGETLADLPITLTTDIGNVPSAALQVQLSAPSPIDVIGPTAQVQIVNPAPVAGPSPVFGVELANDPAVIPTVSGNTWLFNLGTLDAAQIAALGTIDLAVANNAAAGADDLSGTIVASGDGGLTTNASANFANVQPGAIQDIALVALNSANPGGGTETFTLTLSDTNPSGYAAALATQTITLSYVDASTSIACYVRGTKILTDRGDVAVEDLNIGDRLVTHLGEPRPLRWIGRRSYAGRFASRNPDVLPVCIRAGALADGVPRRDLLVSPLHAMYFDGVLVPAIHLVNGATIVQLETVEQVEYFHLELETHDVILAEGAPSESFVDDDSRGMFHNAAEYGALYPNAQQVPALYCAPRVTEGFAVEAIRTHLAIRAGLRAPAKIAPFRGNLEYIGADRIEGWAQNPDHPDAPVCLDILVAGQVVAQVLANRFRGDLLAAEIGDGRHAFSIALPLTATQRRTVQVRRSADGALLPCTAEVLLAA